MTIPAPRLADPLATDPEALQWLRDTIHDIESSRDWQRDANLSRLEWFVRERIALGIEEKTQTLRSQLDALEKLNEENCKRGLSAEAALWAALKLLEKRGGNDAKT